MSTRRNTRLAVLAVVVTAGFACVSLVAADFVYAMFVLGAWTPNYWLDRANIPRAASAPDPELGWVRKPNLDWTGTLEGRPIHYRTDRNGFRNAVNPERADIVFIGDSFTEAAYTPEHLTFVQLVGSGADAQAVNLGRGAYGPQQELIVLQRHALAYQPKVIVWQLFTGNDVSDAEEFLEWASTSEPPDLSLFRRYLNNSLLRQAAARLLDLPMRGTAAGRLRYTDGTVRDVRVRYTREPAMPPEAGREIERVIREGAHLCKQRGIQLVVITVPTMLQVLQPFVSFDDPRDEERFLGNRGAGERTEFARSVERICAASGCASIDLFGALRQEAELDNRQLYIPNDEHLDLRGHHAVARVILDWLQTTRNIAVDSKAATAATAGTPTP